MTKLELSERLYTWVSSFLKDRTIYMSKNQEILLITFFIVVSPQGTLKVSVETEKLKTLLYYLVFGP